MKNKTKEERECLEEEIKEERDIGEWKEELRGDYSCKGRMLIIICSLIALICFVQCISAFGITPARTTIDFNSGLERDASFNVVNSEHRAMVLGTDKSGDLADYIILNQTPIYISADEETKEIKYHIKLPSSLSPGDHTAQIVVKEIKEESSSQFSALVVLSSQLVVKVPYPGKYIEAAVSIEDAKAGENTTIRIPIVNKGYEDLGGVFAKIEIYDQEGNHIMTLEGENLSLSNGERKDIVAVWESKVPAGNYIALVDIEYDGQRIQIEKNFSLGIVELKIEDMEFGSFKLGGIARVNLRVRNQWNGLIENAHSRILLYDSFGRKIREFSSPDVSIEPGEDVVLVSYLEGSGISAGNYIAEIYLENNKISSRKEFVLEIGEDYIGISGMKLSSSRNRSLIIAFICVSIAVIFILFFFLIKRRK